MENRHSLDRALVRSLFENEVGGEPTNDEVWREINEALAIERPVGLADTPPAMWLANLTEWERRDVLRRVLAGASDATRPKRLWALGNAFFDRGLSRLSASIFLQAALMEECDKKTRAALIIKAGVAGNDGCLGPGVDRWLVIGSGMLDELDQSGAAVRLTRFLAEYTATRYFYFMDAPLKAHEHYARVREASGAVADLLGIQHSSPIPDVLLLKAQIARSSLDVLGHGSLSEILEPLQALSGCKYEPVILGSTLVHHVEFQRAAALRLDQTQLANASAAANLSCEALTGLSVSDVCRDVDALFDRVNRRRLGYLLCLAAEIDLDGGPSKAGSALGYLHAASRSWSDPHYARGLSRSAQLEAVVLMREGRRWSHASRSLSESIAYARTGEASASEARAIASKVALHRAMVHLGRAKQYEDRLSKIRRVMHAYWPTHLGLERLKDETISWNRGKTFPSDGKLISLASEQGLWGDDPTFLEALSLAKVAAERPHLRVFISGEMGVGKTQLARFIHILSGRKGRFYTVSLGQTAETLVEDTLFGHKKGAFDGAMADMPGMLEMADQGTLFLDDITNASPHVQRRLYRFLDDGQITRLGDPEPRTVNTSLIFASNKDLDKEVAETRFFDDLRYRIAKFPIRLPPLRERGRDIVIIGNKLFQRFLERERKAMSEVTAQGGTGWIQGVSGLSTGAWDFLCQCEWRGNIRELHDSLEVLVTRLVVSADFADYVNEEGEVTQGFLVKTLQSKITNQNEETLSKSISITPSELNKVCLQQQFSSRSAIADYLKNRFPNYSGTSDSLQKLLRQNDKFSSVIDEYFARSIDDEGARSRRKRR